VIRFKHSFFGMKQDPYGDFVSNLDCSSSDNLQSSLEIQIRNLRDANTVLRDQLEAEQSIRNKIVNLLIKAISNVEKNKLIKNICEIDEDIDDVVIYMDRGKIKTVAGKKL